MNCLIADDEPLILKDIKRTATKVLGEKARFFEATNSDEVLSILKEQDIPIVFLDIEMPFISGLEVAEKIQQLRPRTNIIFVTGHEKYAMDALQMYVSGFLVKPVSETAMRKAIEHLRFSVPVLSVKCFGRFEVLYGGKAVGFKRSLCQEVFAYLVDKAGAFVSEDEIRYLLWSEEQDTEKKRRYVRNIISDIRKALKDCGMENVIINNNQLGYAINRDCISCDLYEYLDGRHQDWDADTETYMEQYAWATPPKARI